jgi:hypothetical protein
VRPDVGVSVNPDGCVSLRSFASASLIATISSVIVGPKNGC